MQTIVWDVDDVLNDLMRAWFTSVWKPENPDSLQSYQDIADNPPYRSLGITRAVYLASLDAFRLSDEACHLTPNPAVLEWLRSYGDGYRHVALTARPLHSAAPPRRSGSSGILVNTFAVLAWCRRVPARRRRSTIETRAIFWNGWVAPIS